MKHPLLVYIIGAYSSENISEFRKAEAVSILLIRAGYHVIKPSEDRIKNEKVGIEMNLHILSRCDAIYILNKESHDGQIEYNFAQSRNIPEVELY